MKNRVHDDAMAEIFRKDPAHALLNSLLEGDHQGDLLNHARAAGIARRAAWIADADKAQNLDRLQLGEPWLTPVYNFEVDGFHTYHVGDVGVWVHNNGCTMTEAVGAALDRVSIPKTFTCFDKETRVFTPGGSCEIKYLDVGDLVLSRCEKTGQQGYRRVISKSEHKCEEALIVAYLPAGCQYRNYISTTAEHPFWVDGMGWVPAGELKVGQKLLIIDPEDQPDVEQCRVKGRRTIDFINSGKLIPAEVTGIEKESNFDGYDEDGKPYYVGSVCSIEVEEFHTYFVGWNGIWVHNKPDPLSIKANKQTAIRKV